MYSGITCELREVLLKDKPLAMLALSSKATVPVLQVNDQVLDESIDIMHWALSTADPDGWDSAQLKHELVVRNDGEFKAQLDRYKYFERYPEKSQQEYFELGQHFIAELEANMVADETGVNYLITPAMSAIDAAIFPFVRQFAHVERNAFAELPFEKVKAWLAARLESSLFTSVMRKYPFWQEGDGIQLFTKRAQAE